MPIEMTKSAVISGRSLHLAFEPTDDGRRRNSEMAARRLAECGTVTG
jgi:hypothetical protein